MLTMELTELSKAEIAEAVTAHCNRFGNVQAVTILQPADRPEVAFAMVSMGSTQSVDDVVKNLDASRVGSMAVIKLEQQPRGVPMFLLKAAQADSPRASSMTARWPST